MTGRQDIVVSDDQIQVVVNFARIASAPSDCTVTYNGSAFAQTISYPI